jgi:predicted MFS family arabinose efflux permease
MDATQSVAVSSNPWLILALLFACRTGLGFQFQTLGSVSGSLVEQLGFSYAEIGTLIGFFMLPGLVLALPAGYAGRYLADRTLVTFGLMALGVGGAIASFAQGFGLLALGRIAAGIGSVFSTIYMTKMVADWFAGKELATAMGILVMSWPFGIAMGQVGHVWVAANFDWRAAFLVAAVSARWARSRCSCCTGRRWVPNRRSQPDRSGCRAPSWC